MRARRREPGRESSQEPPDHGPHTLRVWEGEVVGLSGDDVFVELGPRMQGVLSRRKFAHPPEVGERYEFTLHGQEESLWALSLREEASLVTWEQMEPGAQVEARVLRRTEGGLQLMVGPLHGFMPRSHTGLPRGESLEPLVGKAFTCEVLEVDRERQRVLLSRKLVLERQRQSQRQREVSALRPGTVVQGRVSRIEAYGVFLSFGAGLTGLIHVSNLAHERVEHPRELVQPGQHLEARVLHVRERGRKIALGLKQMQHSPWSDAPARYELGRVVAGEVTRVTDYGAFVQLEPGIEGLVHRSELGLDPAREPRERFTVGQPVSVRVQELDAERERLSLSLLHTDGSRIAPEEAAGDASFRATPSQPRPFGNALGAALRKALDSEAP